MWVKPAQSMKTGKAHRVPVSVQSLAVLRDARTDWARHHGRGRVHAEFALAHVEGSATVATYARDDLLERRRSVMQQWADPFRGSGGGP